MADLMNLQTILKQGYDLLLGSVAAFYVFMAPYTKVEESFNVQVLFNLLNIWYFGFHDFGLPPLFSGYIFILFFKILFGFQDFGFIITVYIGLFFDTLSRGFQILGT